MIITAMYLFGIINHAWSFSWWYGLLAFIMDLGIVSALKPEINLCKNKSDNNEEDD